LQNFPEIPSATTCLAGTNCEELGQLGQTRIDAPRQRLQPPYVVRFYSNPRDTGEGKMVIGDILVTISSTGINPGFVLIADSIAVRTVPVRQSIIATATTFTVPRNTTGFTGKPGPSGRLH
jgi:hypothetical protein